MIFLWVYNQTNPDILEHYGIKGMKWGIRRSPAQLGHTTGTKKKKKSGIVDAAKKMVANHKQKKAAKAETEHQKKLKKKKISEMSDDELRERIARLELEKRYRDLSPKETHRGRDFVMDVLEKSSKNIATQATTYAMGTLVNRVGKAMGAEGSIVNPKKGQKDK